MKTNAKAAHWWDDESVICKGCKTQMTTAEFFKHKCPTPGGKIVRPIPRALLDAMRAPEEH